MSQSVLSLSYGKDSLACIEAIRILGYPLDRIVHAEVWATDTIPADLPPMVEFKKYADRIIKQRYGIDVEHIYAVDKNGEKLTYEKMFYHKPVRRKSGGGILGFATIRVPWCNSQLKLSAIQRISAYKGKLVQKTQNYLRGVATSTDFRYPYTEGIGVRRSKRKFSTMPHSQGAITNTVRYLGIAADEPLRIERHKDKAVMPLVDIGWDEKFCRKWCEENRLLAPTYTDSLRGGCWFCHNQSVGQLRLLRKKYPEYWQLLLKWDNDSPVTFKPDGHTVHDFDKRFALEDEGIILPDAPWKWGYIDGMPIQLRLC